MRPWDLESVNTSLWDRPVTSPWLLQRTHLTGTKALLLFPFAQLSAQVAQL